MGRRTLAGSLVLAAMLLLALGLWQIERRAWKHALIARVEARLAAPPIAAPGPPRWPAIDGDSAYTRVRITGQFGRGDTFVQAVTAAGAGYWVLTPFIAEAGWTVLVNRGFAPAKAVSRSDATIVTGLLRTTEPGGGFLRRNDPAADRWYSRDIAAIAAHRRLGRVAPYFIDADARGTGWPRGGMTVVRFPDNHLVYALTWFALAGLAGWGAWFVLNQRG